MKTVKVCLKARVWAFHILPENILGVHTAVVMWFADLKQWKSDASKKFLSKNFYHQKFIIDNSAGQKNL